MASSTTTAAGPTATANGTLAGFDVLLGSNQATEKYQNVTIGTFFSSLGISLAAFAAQMLAFLLLKGRLPRIYQPRTYLVPERERTRPSPPGLWRWAVPVFRTSNSDFIQKCGLDAYFFLRYLRMLLKIFVPMACLILPILLPINAAGGRNEAFATGPYRVVDPENVQWRNVTGLDQLAWGNVRPENNRRYWAHLVLAVVTVAYVCYVFFDELRGYIRLRQAYLTSPQHRLRASATTVLVTTIPRKWCTVEALEGLYDVFPGGIRNIWINRNFDELNDKVQLRDRLARRLEAAETALIRKCKQAHTKATKKADKAARRRRTKEEQAAHEKREQASAEAAALQGVSANNPHQVHHTVDDALYGSANDSSRDSSRNRAERLPLKLVENVGKGVAGLGKTLFGGVKNVGKDLDNALSTTQGLQVDGAGEASGSGEQRLEERPGTSGTTKSAARRMLLEEAASASREASASGHGRTGSGHSNGADGTTIDKDRAATGSPDTRVEEDARLATDAQDFADKSKAQEQGPPEPRTVPLNPRNDFHFWRQERNVLQVPSPLPHGADGYEFPLASTAKKDQGPGEGDRADKAGEDGGIIKKITTATTTGSITKPEDYPPAYDETYDPNADDPVWKKYIQQKDRETMRIPYLAWWWLSWLPFFGRKVDTIDFCRKEVARLNLEIEQDQKEPEKFPHMNSAFIQFNHQVAAHLACQAVSHHIPNQMAPRVIEIAPDDVLWDNMSIKWWERYLRTAGVLLVVIALVLGWVVPVAFTGALSQVSSLAGAFPNEFGWLERIPSWGISIVQGVLPPALLALLLVVLPMILRLLSRAQGIVTNMLVELSLANYYFFFLFVQVFLVATFSSGITQVWSKLTANITNVTGVLATNLPKASNYFFSYLILQSLSSSAAALLQIGALFFWFIWASMVDATARDKWARQINLPQIDWGTFFPLYTVFAVIGLAYATIAPLILIFCCITFSLFWFAYRFTTLYVTKFKRDTGGLLFPKAINQLFVGLYVMELCLIGLFFVVTDSAIDASTGIAYADTSTQPCLGQGIIMIVVLAATALYQVLLNRSFGPLLRYLPITLEDDAVLRDEAFARMQAKKWALANGEGGDDDGDDGVAAAQTATPGRYDGAADGTPFGTPAAEGDGEGYVDIHDALEARERRSLDADRRAEADEQARIAARRHKGYALDPRRLVPEGLDALASVVPGSWADKSRERARARRVSARENWVHRDAERPAVDASEDAPAPSRVPADAAAVDIGDAPAQAARQHRLRSRGSHPAPGAGAADDDAEAGAADGPLSTAPDAAPHNGGGKAKGSASARARAAETARARALADALFAGLNDEIEDLTPEERDALVRRAFRHEALRARRPAVWLPRDELGVSDDAVRRATRLSGHLWYSNEGAGLDAKARVVYRRSPPDFSELDLIEL